MSLSVYHVLLLSLVALATAAPVAEETPQHLEQAVSVNGDNSSADRAKRAKEEIVFGNQQNGGRAAGMAKKSFDLPPLFMDGHGFMPEPGFDDPNSFDKTGYLYAEKERPVEPELPPPVVEESKTIIEEKPVVEVSKTVIEESKPEVKEAKIVVEESKPVVEEVETKVVEPATQVSSENEEAGSGKEAEAGSGQAITTVEEITVPEAELTVQAAKVKQVPEDSKAEDAEEVLESQHLEESLEEPDEIENLLKELHEEGKAEVKADLMEGEEAELKEKVGEKVEVKEKSKLEQEDEADLRQMSVGDNDVLDLDSEYSNNLLQFLLNEDRMYRLPYPYNYPPYLQRRRRSLKPHPRLHHIHSRHRSKELARAKRTKRDLLDDDMYYNGNEEEYSELPPEISEANLEDLMAYLLALYPSLYEPQTPAEMEYPGYKWYGAGYPEDSYPAPEVPVQGWEEPELGPEYVETPAGYDVSRWEPVFYPEPVEPQESPYYPAPAKRQMLSFVPGSRRKRYFFPFSREPSTHWGAFVPAQEKRDYEDAYRRLRELALVLADARNPTAYSDAFEEYKKKK